MTSIKVYRKTNVLGTCCVTKNKSAVNICWQITVQNHWVTKAVSRENNDVAVLADYTACSRRQNNRSQYFITWTATNWIKARNWQSFRGWVGSNIVCVMYGLRSLGVPAKTKHKFVKKKPCNNVLFTRRKTTFYSSEIAWRTNSWIRVNGN